MTATTTPSGTDRDGAGPLLLDVPGACEMLNIGSTQMYELIRAGAIQSVMIGRRRLVPLSALHDYVARLLSEQTQP